MAFVESHQKEGTLDVVLRGEVESGRFVVLSAEGTGAGNSPTGTVTRVMMISE